MPADPTPWTNQDITLFHGTDERSGQSIIRQGILLELCRPNRDFGQAFYTTTNRTQAEAWARKLGAVKRRLPVLLEFRVARGNLASLADLWFVRGTAEDEDYWSLVEHCRRGNPDHARPRSYDLVIGPVSAPGDRMIIEGYDQISFNTPSAIEFLNRAEKSLLPL